MGVDIKVDINIYRRSGKFRVMKFSCRNISCKNFLWIAGQTIRYSLSNLFRVFNFRGSDQPRKYFDNENFQIYGIYTYILYFTEIMAIE